MKWKACKFSKGRMSIFFVLEHELPQRGGVGKNNTEQKTYLYQIILLILSYLILYGMRSMWFLFNFLLWLLDIPSIKMYCYHVCSCASFSFFLFNFWGSFCFFFRLLFGRWGVGLVSLLKGKQNQDSLFSFTSIHLVMVLEFEIISSQQNNIHWIFFDI